MVAQETPQLEGPETPVPSAEPALRQQSGALNHSRPACVFAFATSSILAMLRSCSSGIVSYGARI